MPFTDYPDGDPWSPTDTAQEADTVYHEYTHGLSNRLVVDVRGHNTLGEAQGNKSEAARLLGLPRSTFCSKLKKHGLIG